MEDRSDPYFDWSSVFAPGDVVRLPDGEVGVVVDVWDCSEDSRPPYWEMYVRHRRSGMVNAGIVKCAAGSAPASDPTSRAEAQRRGLFD